MNQKMLIAEEAKLRTHPKYQSALALATPAADALAHLGIVGLAVRILITSAYLAGFDAGSQSIGK